MTKASSPSLLTETFHISKYSTSSIAMSKLCPGEDMVGPPLITCPGCRHTQAIPEGKNVKCHCGLTLENAGANLLVTGTVPE